MEYRKFQNTYVVRMDKGEEIVEQVLNLAKSENIQLAEVNALGAINDFTVGVLHTDIKKFHPNTFSGTYEITSLHGTITTLNGEPYAHLHLSAGDENGLVRGGHLARAVVSATCEMVIREIPGTVEREYSDEVGLNLMKFL